VFFSPLSGRFVRRLLLSRGLCGGFGGFLRLFALGVRVVGVPSISYIAVFFFVVEFAAAGGGGWRGGWRGCVGVIFV
jgi:hypothetical protein